MPILKKIDKYKKWLSLIGGILINFSLGSFDIYGNFSPYLISYIREKTNTNLRYSNTFFIFSIFTITMALSSFLTGLIITKYKIKLKLVVLIGSILSSSGVILTYFTVQNSIILFIFTFCFLNGIGCGINFLIPFGIILKVII